MHTKVMRLFDNTVTVLQRALDVRLAWQNILASNAAHIDTPGYKEKGLHFSQALHGVLAASSAGARRGALQAATYTVNNTQASLDENGVDLDRTMVAMAENGLFYGALTRAAGKKLAILKYVAGGGM